MSKIMESQTEFNDLGVLCESVQHHGFAVTFTEGFGLVSLRGYGGERFQAHLGIKKDNFRKVTGSYTYGDLGFLQGADGVVTLIGDDLLISSSEFVELFDRLKLTYAEKKYVKEIQQEGFALVERTENENGEPSLRFAEILN
jgi:uncharacterized protein DUF1257